MKKCICLLLAIMPAFGVSAQQNLQELYGQKKYDEVIRTGLEILQQYPDQPEVNMLVGRAYTEKKQFGKAVPYLEKGTVKDNNKAWVQAWSHTVLGHCYYILNEYQKSKESLNASVALNATANSTRSAQKMQRDFQMTDFYDNWEILETDNIRFHFQNLPGVIVDKTRFINERQATYVKINGFFNAKLFKKIDYYVWSNSKQGEEMLGSKLGFAKPDICLINSRTNQTTGHEIAHVLVGQGIGTVKKTAFINEGVATYFDQNEHDRLAAAKTLLAGKDISIADLWENPTNFPEEYNYGIGGAWIACLFEKGTTDQIKKLLKDQTLASAKAIYPGLDQRINDFEKKLKE